VKNSKSMASTPAGHAPSTGRSLVIHPTLKRPPRELRDALRTPEARLEEAVALAGAIDLEIAHAALVPLAKPKPATLIGSGSVETLGAIVKEREISVAVVDAIVSPVQQRNLEKAWGCKVIDRTGLILEIFGARARTHEGRLQVELAALTYQRSRLVRSWTHLERQRGGFGFLGGPGESQLEIDRRLIGERIARIKKELEDTKRTRALHRGSRKRVPYPIVALVGYTNAGKSTLFNRLTEAAVRAEDSLFATLDPTLRRLALPSGRTAILSDTVGFISELPHQLVAAFRATLEEVTEADLIVHVRDVHHPDTDAQRRDVEDVLTELGLEAQVEHGLLEALNKIDLLDPAAHAALLHQALRNDGAVPISAATGEGCDQLLSLVEERVHGARQLVDLNVPLSDGAAIAWLYQNGDVVSRRDDEERAHLSVRLADADLGRFRSRQIHH
jgi:GTP-binding protein HflX